MISSCLYVSLEFDWLLISKDLSLPITRYRYICFLFVFEKQRYITSSSLDGSCACESVLYSEEKRSVLM